MAIITISRQSGSLGREIAEQLAENLSIPLIKRKTFINEHFKYISNPYDISMLEKIHKFYLKQATYGIKFKEHMKNRLIAEAERAPV